MPFVCHPNILHEHCLQVLLGIKMTPKETENNAYANFLGSQTKSIMICYGIFRSGQFVGLIVCICAICLLTSDVFISIVLRNWLYKTSQIYKFKIKLSNEICLCDVNLN